MTNQFAISYNKKTKAILLSVVGIVTSLLCSLAHSHHAFTLHFDPSRTLELEGTVTEFKLRNPHAFFTLEAVGDDGETVIWEVELPGAVLLRRMGVTQETFSPGDNISVAAMPNRKEGNNLVYGRAMTAASGVVYGEHPDLTAKGAEQEVASSIDGLWSSPLPFLNKQPALPLNDAGQAALENYDITLSPATTCEPFSIPDLQLSPYLTEIIISDDKVEFVHEAYGMRRTIPIDSEPVAVDTTGYLGMASARIEDGVLIIESYGYPASDWGLSSEAQPKGPPADVPSSEQKRVTERYSVSEDGQVLTLEYELTDPEYLSEIYMSSMIMNRAAEGVVILPFECEVESARRFAE